MRETERKKERKDKEGKSCQRTCKSYFIKQSDEEGGGRGVRRGRNQASDPTKQSIKQQPLLKIQASTGTTPSASPAQNTTSFNPLGT